MNARIPIEQAHIESRVAAWIAGSRFDITEADEAAEQFCAANGEDLNFEQVRDAVIAALAH